MMRAPAVVLPLIFGKVLGQWGRIGEVKRWRGFAPVRVWGR